jgi:hypothetical protein
MEYAFLISKKHGEQIEWRDIGRIERIAEIFTGSLLQSEWTSRRHIDRSENDKEDAPMKCLLITAFKDVKPFRTELYERGYEIIESRETQGAIIQ